LTTRLLPLAATYPNGSIGRRAVGEQVRSVSAQLSYPPLQRRIDESLGWVGSTR